MRMGGFSCFDPAAGAAGDPHTRSLRRAKPVYSGQPNGNYCARAQHAMASPEGARSVLVPNLSRPARRLYRTVRGAECPHCASTPQRQPNTPQDGTVALPCRWATKFLYPSSTHQPLVQTLPNSQDCPCSTERGVTQENILRWNTPERPMNITAVPRFHNRIMTVASNR